MLNFFPERLGRKCRYPVFISRLDLNRDLPVVQLWNYEARTLAIVLESRSIALDVQ